MKKTIKMLSLLLALVMMFGMATIAMAEENLNPLGDNPYAPDADGYDITINGQAEDHVYYAYQIIDGALGTNGFISNPEWGAGFNSASFLTALKADDAFKIVKDGDGNPTINMFASVNTVDEFQQAVSAHLDPNGPLLDKVADYMVAHLGTAAGHPSTPNAVDGKIYTITGLDAGYYLIVDTDGDTTNKNDFISKYMLYIIGNQTLAPKGTYPTLDKTVSDTDGTGYKEAIDLSISEIAYFRIDGELAANYDTDYDHYYYKLFDQLPAGMLASEVVIDRIYIKPHTGTENFYFKNTVGGVVTVDLSDYYTYSVDTVNNTFYIEFGTYTTDATHVCAPDAGSTKDCLKCLDASTATALEQLTITNTSDVIVEYHVPVNINATVGKEGNTNTASITYTNDPSWDGKGTPPTGETPPDPAIVFTFTLDVDKVDTADTTKKLADAKFVFQRTSDSKYAKVDQTAGSPTYGKIIEWVVNQTDASELTTNSNGEILIYGMDAGSYQLIETEAPSGYNKLRVPVPVVIESVISADGVLIGFNYTVDSIPTHTVSTDSNFDAVAYAQVKNGTGTTLPSTGGIGTTMFYLFGGLMACAATVLLVTKKRMAY